MILLRGGTVLTDSGWTETDVVVDGSQILQVGRSDHPADQTFDVSGMLVGPGFVDLHTHFRDPGQVWKEDLESGSRSAAAGGFTGVVNMPNTSPPLDTVESVADLLNRAQALGIVEIGVAAAITKGRAGDQISDIEGLYRAGVRMFSNDGDTVADPELLAAAMSRLADLPGATLAQHAEDPVLSRGGHLHQGQLARQHNLVGVSPEAEWKIIQRDLEIAAATGARYHAQHLSTAEGVELIAGAKQENPNITAEVTPHHLFFTVDDVEGLDTNLKMYPPLRTDHDRQALRQGLRSGAIDAVATDHAPHAHDEKRVPFEQAPRGVTGLETAAAVVWGITPDRLFEVLSINPARIAGMERQGRTLRTGGPANLVVFDPRRKWVPTRTFSKSTNNPFRTVTLTGQVQYTICEGRLTYSERDT